MRAEKDVEAATSGPTDFKEEFSAPFTGLGLLTLNATQLSTLKLSDLSLTIREKSLILCYRKLKVSSETAPTVWCARVVPVLVEVEAFTT